MGWRDRKINQLITEYRDESFVSTLTDIQKFECHSYVNKAATFRISTATLTEPVQFSAIQKSCIPVDMSRGKPLTEPLAFSATIRHPQYLLDNSARVTVVPFDEFPIKVTRFSFQGIRQEKTLQPRITEPPIGRWILKRTKHPPRSVLFDDTALEERLRWILTRAAQTGLSVAFHYIARHKGLPAQKNSEKQPAAQQTFFWLKISNRLRQYASILFR